MSKKRKKQPVPLADKILIPILALAVIGAGIMLANYKSFIRYGKYDDILKMDTIYNNIFINNMEVGGLTREQALEKLTRVQQQGKFEPRVINLQLPDGGLDDVVAITYKECGMKYDYAPEIEEAYSYGRKGSVKERIAAIEELENKGEFYTSEFSWDRDMVVAAIKKHEDEINAQYLNGEKMDVERTADMVEGMLEIDAYDSHIDIPTK
ncbi:MAG: peptidoglycan binding domain-containing protein [Firmicutes bacterium]|nr:peptidoglycan binding domain-containing protein [Bacillota bacterium]